MTDLDLDKIKKSVSEVEELHPEDRWEVLMDDIPDLIAEVERLRAIVDDQAQRIHTLENY